MAKMILRNAYVEIEENADTRECSIKVKSLDEPTSKRNPMFVMKAKRRFWERRTLRRLDQ